MFGEFTYHPFNEPKLTFLVVHILQLLLSPSSTCPWNSLETPQHGHVKAHSLQTSQNGFPGVSSDLVTNPTLLMIAGQTFEGGVSSRPDAEAHGAYAFCALGCLSILGDPHIVIPKYEHTLPPKIALLI